MDREPVALAYFTRWMSAPATSTRPSVGVFEPVIISNSVVLPAPFGPTTPTMRLSGKERSASSVKVGRSTSAPRV